MNYIGLLTKEEKSTLCEIITGKEFKELFKRNEQEFAKVQKGFRAKSLTEQHALSIAISITDFSQKYHDNITFLEETRKQRMSGKRVLFIAFAA